MKYGLIATWMMSLESVKVGVEYLGNNAFSGDVIEKAINKIEDYPYFKSVGYGGLPNEDGVVELDGAYMDGENLEFGAIAGSKMVKNPITLARRLSKESFNNVIVGQGADRIAKELGLKTGQLVTKRAKQYYQKRIKEIKEKNLSAYDGHDTVGMVALDKNGKMVAGTSTSGLFMKKEGRVGDSPFIGSGLYCDNEVGGCVATGVGEEIMKSCISFEVVRKMKDGIKPMEACLQSLNDFNTRMKKREKKVRAISIVALNNQGEYGVASNVDFTFIIGNQNLKTTVYNYKIINDEPVIEASSNEEIHQYYERIKAPIE